MLNAVPFPYIGASAVIPAVINFSENHSHIYNHNVAVILVMRIGLRHKYLQSLLHHGAMLSKVADEGSHNHIFKTTHTFQKSEFLMTGSIYPRCGGNYCRMGWR